MKSLTLLVVSFLLASPAPRPALAPQGGSFTRALADATKALDNGELERAEIAIGRALERDPNSLEAWALSERWAEKKNDKDERVYALHRQLNLARAQGKEKPVLEALRARLLPLDPIADTLWKLKVEFVQKLTQLAEGYEKGRRPHSAIRAYKQALALDPERADIRATIERLAAAPDPSLAEDARPRDLLEGISADWIADFDKKHLEWKDRGVMEKPNYRTQTDAGYEVLVRTAEAMEQMNAFYRIFFRYGAEGDKRNPSPIDVNIFKTRDEYTKDPNDWSGGHFTGSAVETYIGPGGFEDMTGTLFHEAAHQFVSLATNAAGWLNEGLASFFEGTRILANGTVIMNLPANHRLFPLVERMEKGFMEDVRDGIDPNDVTKDPPKAPSFRIVLEDQYTWGPPWYAPTWGVVYFLYNRQDPSDGRFVYRKAFFDFVNASGGRSGKNAISTFEELVLANPEPVTEGITSALYLPKTVDELNAVWKDYLFDLRDRQRGSNKSEAPYLDWAKLALKRGALEDAAEFYEKAWQHAPNDVTVLEAFAEFLAAHKKEDRAGKLLTQALAVLENTEPLDQKRLGAMEQRLRKIDPAYQRLDDVRVALVKQVSALLERYLAEGLNLQAMDVALNLGSELQEPALYDFYERGVRAVGHPLASWRLAYNEEDLRGWNSKGLESTFKADGVYLDSQYETYSSSLNDYQILSLNELTSGDFSLECEVDAEYGKVNFAGLVFGRKSPTDCHALVLFPPAVDKNGFVNLVSFYGGSADTWRRNPVQHPDSATASAADKQKSRASTFYKLRIDIVGRLVDVWVNGEYQATQEFPSLDILRGSFGLITGRGQARFKNVRFLARSPHDPSAAIERKMTIEEKSAGGEAINGSWLGLVPPFPTVQQWFQEPRESWEEAKGYPQLLVLWSTEQNDQVAIDKYLADLAAKYASSGLKIVNVLAFWNENVAENYVREHAFPGSVGLDTPTQAERNFGVTLERFDVMRFHLPRFLLLDIDGKVAWEGDPGFAKGAGWGGEESLLDVPLRELVAKRRLTEFTAWRKAWPAAREALALGEFEKAVPALKGAEQFDATVSEEVAEAGAIVAAVEGAAGGLDALAEKLSADGREPALEVVLDWAQALGKPAKRSKSLAAILKGPNIAAWKRAPGMLKPLLAKAGKDPAAIEGVLEKITALPGAFPAEFAEAARANADDAAALKAVIDDSAALPARWLASEHFGW